MKQLFYAGAACILTLAACTGSFKKGQQGLEYKIISSGSGKKISYGNFLQMHVKQVYAGGIDSVLSDSRDYMAPIQVFDSVNTPVAYFNILKQMRKGDSLIIRLLTDSAFSNRPQGMPPFMKKGKFVYTYVKLVNVFESEKEADSASKAELVTAKPRIFKKQIENIEKEIAKNKEQLDKDDKLVSAYLAKNNIKATKTKWGTYMVVTEPGSGSEVSYNSVVSVNYTGRTLDSGKVFDSNVDPKFGHVGPIDVNISNLGGVVLGWTDALLKLKKGAKATIYIPSFLSYGKMGRGADIKPDDNLIFDMEITDVLTEEEVTAKQLAMQQEMIEKEKKRVDSIQKATDKKNAATKK